MRRPRKGDLLLFAGELWRVKKNHQEGLECECNLDKFVALLIEGIDDYVLLTTSTYYSRF